MRAFPQEKGVAEAAREKPLPPPPRRERRREGKKPNHANSYYFLMSGINLCNTKMKKKKEKNNPAQYKEARALPACRIPCFLRGFV